MKTILSQHDVRTLAKFVAASINMLRHDMPMPAYAVPRGGIPAAYAIAAAGANIYLVDEPDNARLIIDDIVDSGATRDRFAKYNLPFFSLIDKGDAMYEDAWIVFPWEVSSASDQSATDNITRLLQYVGENPKRGGLLETPSRVIKAWDEWCSGYGRDPAKALKVFEDGGEDYNQIVLVRDIPFYSTCEHHMATFFGTAHVGYIPNGKVVGLSKIPEVVDIFARRLQVQERLTNQIADAIWEHLQPKAVGVVMSARHMCMESRGKKKAGSSTVTSALRGTMATELACRSEFMSLIKI
jgi:GTP cyclohydrolase I